MAGWYVRRGEKVVGPVDSAKLKELAAAGKVLPTDQLAKDAAGPWTDAGKTSLFASKPAPQVDRPKPLVPVIEPRQVPAVIEVQAKQPPATLAAKILTPFKTAGRVTVLVTTTVSRGMSERSRRKHELRLAEIEARARNPGQPAASTAAPSITFAPTMVQKTVVKVKGGGCGCSGCGTLLLLVLLLIIAAAVYSVNSTVPLRP